ncbi:MAG: peptidase [Actinomycetota bacterium]
MRRRTGTSSLIVGGALALLMMTTGLGTAAPTPVWKGQEKHWPGRGRAATPEDRYAMAGGCYSLGVPSQGYVTRTEDGYSLSGNKTSAEPFRFQATGLGTYLLFDTAEEHVAASEGTAGEVAYGVTKSQPGAIVGGIAREQTDDLADEVARGPLGEATGRGASLVAAEEPTELADWKVKKARGAAFSFSLPATDQVLTINDGSLELANGDPAPFHLELKRGCARFPEIEVNVDGPLLGGVTEYQEVRGFFDAHLHMMAFEFLGGRARCGRPWHAYGVTRALIDCPDHEPGFGRGALLEQILKKDTPGTEHNTDGWPTFEGWPKYNSLTHEQVYYKWLERAWRGGLRMFTNLLVDNGQLCNIYPYKRNSCNEMDGVRLQHRRIHELQDYIDAQNGGPGEGWFRIVKDPFEARRVINEGKLAVVLGIEVSVPLDCGEKLEVPQCDENEVMQRLDEVYEDLGVRQMELVNKFDNALSGVAGDAGDLGLVVNQGNLLETGHYWKMDTCEEETEHAHDKHQHNIHDQSGAPDDLSGRDSLVGAILSESGKSGAAPVYPEGPHCNTIGLTELGETMIRAMADKGIIFDPDHMSAKAQAQALDLVRKLDYSGIVSSHGWSNDSIYPQIYELGGVVAPYAGGSAEFVDEWRKHRKWADPRYYFGFGYGADTNGFGTQGGPRGADAKNPVAYPFEGFGGTTIHPQQSGTRPQPYDINVDGVAHYGLYPDWIEDLRKQAGDKIVEDMARSPEAYLQMWERAIGIAPDSCRTDVPDLAESVVAKLQRGMSPERVIRTLGQPATRIGNGFGYCMKTDRSLTVRFSPRGEVQSWQSMPG